MRRIDSLNLAQRIVLVVATGLAIRVLTLWLLVRGLSSGGWFGYAPNTSLMFRGGSGASTGVTALVSVVAVALWAAIALRLLATKQNHD